AKILKVKQSSTNILGGPSNLCPPCTLPACIEPQPVILPIKCPLPERSFIFGPPPPPRISCPPPTICPPPQPCPATLTCPRPVPCPLPPPPRPPPPPIPFPLPIPPQIICPPRANIFATTINAQNDCCCNCGFRSCRIFPSSTQLQKRHFLATFGTRTHSESIDFSPKLFNNILGDMSGLLNDNNNAKCNSELLRKIIIEVMNKIK
ncbi:hypothetical protein Mgra_00007540, partial [Meloidogyne graminicola]